VKGKFNNSPHAAKKSDGIYLMAAGDDELRWII